jgi:hypothetical protein
MGFAIVVTLRVRLAVALGLAVTSGLMVQEAQAALVVQLKLPANIAPAPDYNSSAISTLNGQIIYANPCFLGAGTEPSYSNSPACTDYILLAIDAARVVEGVKPMILPLNWYNLSATQQLFVIADLERVDRGLPPYLGLNAALSANAQAAAATTTDPNLASGFAVGTNPLGTPGFGATWAQGMSPLTADYLWMYVDGWGGGPFPKTLNGDCTSATALGCWSHRDELLGSAPGFNLGVGLHCTTCEMGTGFASVRGHGSYTDLVELPKGSPPATSFTWAKDVAPFLGGSNPTGPALVSVLSSYLAPDSWTSGTGIGATTLAPFAAQIQAQLAPLLSGTEQDVSAFSAWTTMANLYDQDYAMRGLVAFSGPVPVGLAAIMVTQACAAFGGTPGVTAGAPGVVASLEAQCTDSNGLPVTVITWTEGNVQALVVVDGKNLAPSVAEAIAVTQDALTPTTGINLLVASSWHVVSTNATLSNVQHRRIADIAKSLTVMKPTSVSFAATVTSGSAAARAHARGVVNAVAQYLGSQLVKDGMSAATISALAINHPVVTSFSTVKSATSVVINVRHLH